MLAGPDQSRELRCIESVQLESKISVVIVEILIVNLMTNGRLQVLSPESTNTVVHLYMVVRTKAHDVTHYVWTIVRLAQRPDMMRFRVSLSVG